MRKTLCLAGFASALLFVSTGFTQQPMPPIAVPYSQALPTQPRPLPAPPVAHFAAAVATPAEPMTTKVIDIAEVILQSGTKATPEACEDRAKRLMHFLEGYVSPTTWEDVGGKGSMVYFGTNHTLVVNNQAKVVKEVETWIDRMRVATKPKVNVSIHTVRCATGALAKLGYETKAKEAIVLTPTQHTAAMKALKTDPRFEVISSPSMFLLENQTGFFQVGQHVDVPYFVPMPAGQAPVPAPPAFVGSTIRSTPRLSPDGKTIQVRIESECSHLAPAKPTPDVFLQSQTADGNAALVRVLSKPPEAPRVKSQSVTTTFTVPQGGTALVPMGTQAMTERTEWKVPVLGDVPVVDCLFRGSCSEEKECELFMLVTASSQTEPTVLSGGPVTPREVTTCPTPAPMMATVRLVGDVQAVAPSMPGATVPVLPPPAMGKSEYISVRLAEYRKACAQGRTEVARIIATQLLAVDPTCFQGK